MTDRLASIDGIRAIAVMAVLIFHVDKTVLPGGYLGVDLFFVISGFVVSKSLLENRPRFGAFVARRFYRLAPAAATTILTTLAVFNFTGTGLLSGEHISSALAALLAVSNIYSMLHSSYFDTALQGNPFLHFWSLSVEEQFYLVWPWIFAFIGPWSIGKKITFVVLLASLSYLFDSLSSTQAFFLMPARAYQFGCGALVYIAISQRLMTFPPALLLPSLIASVVLFCTNNGTQNWLFGWFIPTVAFSILIGAAAFSRSIILTNSLMQLLGHASYSIYLVHWPLIVYSRIAFPEGIVTDIALCAMSLLVGILLHYTIERPFNYRVRDAGVLPLKRRSEIGRYGAPVLSLLAFATWTIIILWGRSTAIDTQTPSEIAKTEHRTITSKSDGFLTATAALWKDADQKLWQCNTYEQGRRDGDTRYKLLAELDLGSCLRGRDMIMVDSTGEVAVPFIATVHNSSDYAILSSSGCSFITELSENDCGRMNALRMEILSDMKCKYSTIFIGNNWGKYTSAQIGSLVDFLSKSSCRVRLLSALPYFTANPSQFVSANGGHSVDLTSRIDPAVWENRRVIHERITSLANIDTLNWSVLDESGAPVPALTDDGHAIYRDNYHYTSEGKFWLVARYLTTKQNQ